MLVSRQPVGAVDGFTVLGYAKVHLGFRTHHFLVQPHHHVDQAVQGGMDVDEGVQRHVAVAVSFELRGKDGAALLEEVECSAVKWGKFLASRRRGGS